MSKSFGQRVREKRLAEGKSQAEVDEIAKISRNYLSLIEREEAINLSWQVKKKLADALGILIEDETNPSVALENLPPGLADFAQEKNLPEADVLMLARLQYRGQQPTSSEQWRVLYNVIKTIIVDE